MLKLKNTTKEVDTIAMETWKNQIKTDEKIEKLSAMVEELKNSNLPKGTLPILTESGTIATVKISGKLLERLMPTMTLSLSKSPGIFGLYIFDQSIAYSTYEDTKYSLRVIPMNVPYDAFLKNAFALGGKPYKVNEIKTLPMRAFYLNPEKTDTLVRLVIESESQTVGLEIPKSNFTLLKNLLLNSTTPKEVTLPVKKK
jgi:hypothetical protein